MYHLLGLTKGIMRLIITTRHVLLNSIPTIIAKLSLVINEICCNPSNPKFNHFAFESLSALLQFSCTNRANVLQVENLIIDPFTRVLSVGLAEFMPYVFQILTQLLNANQGEDREVPAFYQDMLTPIMQPILWKSNANVPALVGLLNAYLSKDCRRIVEQGQLSSFLGVSQWLVPSLYFEHFGIDVLISVFTHVDKPILDNYVNNVFVMLLNRLHTVQSSNFSKLFLKFVVGILQVRVRSGDFKYSSNEIVFWIDSVQPGYQSFFN